MRQLALEVGGSAAVVYGCSQVAGWLGWVVGGGFALYAGWRSAQ